MWARSVSGIAVLLVIIGGAGAWEYSLRCAQEAEADQHREAVAQSLEIVRLARDDFHYGDSTAGKSRLKSAQEKIAHAIDALPTEFYPVLDQLYVLVLKYAEAARLNLPLHEVETELASLEPFVAKLAGK